MLYSFILYYLHIVEPILEKFKFDFNSDEPLDEQELEGNKRLRKHCLEYIAAAKEERDARVEDARDAYQAQLQEEEDLRIQVSNSSIIKSSFRWTLLNFTFHHFDMCPYQ